jgi:hypothetical protein
VTPAQAEKLDLARSVGSLSLVLRNQMDPQAASTEGAMKSSLLDERATPLAQQKTVNLPSLPTLARKKSKPPVTPPKPEVVVAETVQVPEKKIAPVATPAVNNAAAMTDVFCVGVINGVRNSTECY